MFPILFCQIIGSRLFLTFYTVKPAGVFCSISLLFLIEGGRVVVLTGARGITGWNGRAVLWLGYRLSFLWIVIFLWSISIPCFCDFSCFSQPWEDKTTLQYYFSWNLKIIRVIEIICGCLLFSVSPVDSFCPYSSRSLYQQSKNSTN